MIRLVVAMVACIGLAVPALAETTHAECNEMKLVAMKVVVSFDKWYEANVSAASADATPFDFNKIEQCRAMLPIAKKYLERVDLFIDVDLDTRRVCPDEKIDEQKVEGHTLIEMFMILKKYIRACMAEEEGEE